MWYTHLEDPKETRPSVYIPDSSLSMTEVPHSHFILGALLTQSARKDTTCEWLRQNGFPFLSRADEILAYIAYEWDSEDYKFTSDIAQLISWCNELASLVDRYVRLLFVYQLISDGMVLQW